MTAQITPSPEYRAYCAADDDLASARGEVTTATQMHNVVHEESGYSDSERDRARDDLDRAKERLGDAESAFERARLRLDRATA